jgi:hypothetical protein
MLGAFLFSNPLKENKYLDICCLENGGNPSKIKQEVEGVKDGKRD